MSPLSGALVSLRGDSDRLSEHLVFDDLGWRATAPVLDKPYGSSDWHAA